MATFTVLNQDFYAIQGTQAKKNVIEITPEKDHQKAQITVGVFDKDSQPVRLNQLFTSIKSSFDSGEAVEQVSSQTSFVINGVDGAGIALTQGVAKTLAIESEISDIAITGQYTVKVTVSDIKEAVDGEGSSAVVEDPEANLETQYTVKVLTTEQALLNYEKEITKLGEEDITTIDSGYNSLEESRKVVYAAITALGEEEKKNELLNRYYAAAENQYKAFKLIMEYKTVDNELELEKVTNVGGNMPFQITYNKDQVKLGNATKAYVFYPAGYRTAHNSIAGYPDDEPEDILSTLVPEQNTLLVSNDNKVGGLFFLAFQINNIWYRTTYEVNEDGTNLVSVNGISTSVPEQGNEVVLKKHTDKSALTASIKTAEGLIEATTAGTDVGQAPQDAIDTIKAAVEVAKGVMNKVPDYTSYTDVEAFNKLQKQLDDAKTALDEAIAVFQEAIVSDADYAEAKLADYEKSAKEFFNSIRKKIRI